ncbi:MAG: SH3 domain-containing protein [Microcoleaceae cyanobacterium]
MSLNPGQLMIAAVAGITSATSVAYFTINSDSSQIATDSSKIQKLDNNLISVVGTNRLKSSNSTPTAPDLVVEKSTPGMIRPPTSGCKIVMAIVDDPEPPLNIRSSPKVTEGNIIGQLNNNTFVSVVDEQSGWLRITEPVTGWVAKNRTRSSCAKVDMTITFPPTGDVATVKGEIIGGGSHSYRVRVIQGQTVTVRSYGDVFPTIIGPDGQVIAGDPYTEGNRTEWTGVLPVSGVYTLQLDSNFRGFEYEFLVEIQD